MKVEVQIEGISRSEVGDRSFKELVKLFPEGEYNDRFHCRFMADDPKLAKVSSILRSHDLYPWADHFRKPYPNEYSSYWHRIYDEADLEQADYLIPSPRKYAVGLHQLWPKPARLVEGHIAHRVRMVGGTTRSVIALMDELKEQMSAAGLRHLVFLPVEINEAKAWTIDPYWQVFSDYVLPTLSPRCVLKKNGGAIFDGDYSNGCFVEEGLYSDPELHYTRRAADRFEPFDIALTHERFGNVDHVCYPELVVSKRFFEFCKKKKLKMDWTPVRIDAE